MTKIFNGFSCDTLDVAKQVAAGKQKITTVALTSLHLALIDSGKPFVILIGDDEAIIICNPLDKPQE